MVLLRRKRLRHNPSRSCVLLPLVPVEHRIESVGQIQVRVVKIPVACFVCVSLMRAIIL